MKIAILTLPFHANYGGVLQAYALQTVLQRMGHEVVVLDKDMYYHRSWWRQQVALGAFLVRKYLLRKEVEYVNLRKADAEKSLMEKHLRSFVSKRLNILRVRFLPEEFPQDVDAVVVGSDQVWRKKYFTALYGCSLDNAFLSFCEDRTLKRISFAASFGTDDWEYSEPETQLCARLLERFDAVSVREISGMELCRRQLGRQDVLQMPDPTLLLSAKDYLTISGRNQAENRKSCSLVYYVLDETDVVKSFAKKLAQERGLEICRVNKDVDNTKLKATDRIQPPVEDWLNSFASAAFVLTDSFHACVFSIIFCKPFIVIGNAGRGMSRFQSLLSTFGLQRNMISSLCEYDPQFNYNLPDDISAALEKEKARAMAFLKAWL